VEAVQPHESASQVHVVVRIGSPATDRILAFVNALFVLPEVCIVDNSQVIRGPIVARISTLPKFICFNGLVDFSSYVKVVSRGDYKPLTFAYPISQLKSFLRSLSCKIVLSGVEVRDIEP